MRAGPSRALISRRSLHQSSFANKAHILTLRDGRWVKIPKDGLNEKLQFAFTESSNASSTVNASIQASQGTAIDATGIQRVAFEADHPLQSSRIAITPDQPATTITSREYPMSLEGVSIPIRPKAPAEDECCMSGCARCVYDLFQEDLIVYQEGMVEAALALEAKNVPKTLWPPALQQSSAGGKEAARLRADEQADADTGTLNVSMRAFLALERNIRKRNHERLTRETTDGPISWTAASSTPLRS